jgi:hypothetical protein
MASTFEIARNPESDSRFRHLVRLPDHTADDHREDER